MEAWENATEAVSVSSYAKKRSLIENGGSYLADDQLSSPVVPRCLVSLSRVFVTKISLLPPAKSSRNLASRVARRDSRLFAPLKPLSIKVESQNESGVQKLDSLGIISTIRFSALALCYLIVICGCREINSSTVVL